MRVIKEGVKPKEKEKKCGYCKCHFTYSDSDIESDRDGSYVVCPSCKKFLAVGQPQINDRI